jgi:preprotein translocase subunit SecA
LIQSAKKEKRPVLVIFKSIAETNKFSEFLSANGVVHQLLNGTQRESDDYIIARAGEPGTITIATNTACRGTDIILAPESKSAGGLLQVFTYYPKNLRVEGQGFGRAGRQGQPGSCGMILRADDDYILFLLKAAPLELKLAWQLVDNDEQALRILTHLRSLKIQEESRNRRHQSQIEHLTFSYLKQFFDCLQKVENLLDDAQFNKVLLELCKGEIEPTKSPLLSEKEKKIWMNTLRNATVLLENQRQMKQIDWVPFLSQFKHTMSGLLHTYWANFYSKISDEIYGMSIELAQKHVDEQFNQLNLAQHFSEEGVLNCLKDILNKASLQNPPKIQFFKPKPEMDIFSAGQAATPTYS